MNISLTSELKRFIESKVESGMYNSASEVVRQALRLLVEQDEAQIVKLEALREAIHEGVQSGEGESWNLDGFKSRVKKRSSVRKG